MNTPAIQAEPSTRTPRWIWGVLVALALIEPGVHVWIALAPPSGTVPTGLHVLDTASWLTAMRHALGGGYSPYAMCSSALGTTDPSHFALPHYYLYGLIGAAGRMVGAPPFFVLSLANGLSLAFMLWAAWRLLAAAMPRLAPLAFALYTLAGGLGGAIYLVSAVLGWTGSPHFADAFYRHFMYELSEGAHLFPWLLAPRLYYSLPLGLGYLALALLIEASSARRWPPIAGAAAALAISAFFNARYAPVFGFLALAWLVIDTAPPRRFRLGAGAALCAGILAGSLPALVMMWSRPELIEVLRSRDQVACMWVTAFWSAAFFYLWLAPGSVLRALPRLPWALRIPGLMLLGYGVTFFLLIAAYYLYYGNLTRCYDGTAALHVSPWALWGAPLGLLVLLRKTKEEPMEPALPWFALWFVLFYAMAISTLGADLPLRPASNRLQAVLGLPLAALGAEALRRMGRNRPRAARWYASAMLTCGVISMGVTWGVTHGPLGHGGLHDQFPWVRCAFMSEADGKMISHLETGVVLAPSLDSPLFGDVIVVTRPGTATVYGNPTLDYSRENMDRVRTEANNFFTPGAPEEARRALVDAWCVTQVYCPDTCPVATEVIEELRGLPWLRETKAEGAGAVFEVTGG